jgi:aminoglycoside phosphotransferase (APT) family kinase protein
MQSLSKTIVSSETATQIARQHLDGACLTEFRELTDGFFNAAYFLALEDGRRCVLKVAPPADVRVLRYEQNIMFAEVEALRRVRAETNMPVPAILCHDASRTLLPSPFFIMDFIEGEPLNKLRASLSEDQQAILDRTTGRYLSEMNAITGADFGYYAQPSMRKSDWPGAFAVMFANVLQDGLDVNVALPYDDLRPLPESYADALAEVREPHLIHWDLWDGNIFVNPVTLQITGIIDFERVLWADPLMECNFGAFGINQSFIEGYGLKLPYTPTQSIRRALYNTYLYLIMVIECTYRQYLTDGQEKWARGMLERELKGLLG